MAATLRHHRAPVTAVERRPSHPVGADGNRPVWRAPPLLQPQRALEGLAPFEEELVAWPQGRMSGALKRLPGPLTGARVGITAAGTDMISPGALNTHTVSHLPSVSSVVGLTAFFAERDRSCGKGARGKRQSAVLASLW